MIPGLAVCEMLRAAEQSNHFRNMLAPKLMHNWQVPTASSVPHVTDGNRTGGSSVINTQISGDYIYSLLTLIM